MRIQVEIRACDELPAVVSAGLGGEIMEAAGIEPETIEFLRARCKIN